MFNTPSLHDAVCRCVNLGAAFERYRQYRGLWAPGIPMWEVAAAPVVPMLALAERLREDRYKPYAPRHLSIAKANGERRELGVFMIRDRVAQRAVLQVLQARTDASMSPYSFGFRPRRGVVGALGCARGFLNSGLTWVVDADIEHCFDRIPRDLLLKEVERRLDAEAADLVTRVMGWTQPGAREQVGIPQGAVLSPWLCNIYLWQLDDAMRERGAAMVRFADDFVLLTVNASLAARLRDLCAAVLSGMRLRLHPDKTTIVHGTTPFHFLGQWLSPTPLLSGLPATPPGV